MMIKTYSEMLQFSTFEGRFNYLKLTGKVGEMTFNGRRYLNQLLYQNCQEWESIRRQVIIRDGGCDLGCKGCEIYGKIFVHHINPITIEDIIEKRSCLFDLENLISASLNTHNAIHYGNKDLLPKVVTERTENDTCLWR